MRRAAPLILLGFVAILAGVGWTYYVRLKQQAASAPVKPQEAGARDNRRLSMAGPTATPPARRP